MRKIKEVNQLIKDLAEHISGRLKSTKEMDHEIAEKTKALADLISARIRIDCLHEFEGNNHNAQPYDGGSRYILPIIVSLATTIIFNYLTGRL